MRTSLRLAAATALALSLAGTAAPGQRYRQTNLVSNSAMGAPASDSDLVNPWGMSRSASSPWWVTDNTTGLSTLYNGAGDKEGLVVTIPPAVAGGIGSPTGTIYNGSPTDFLIKPGKPALFLFSTLDGTIAGWNPAEGLPKGGKPPSTNAVTVVKTTDGSSYTGLTSATMVSSLYLYAANFSMGRVDVFDTRFNPVHFADARFQDDWLPADYMPFNVQAVGNDIVVTFALHQKGNLHETDGPGLGFVDIFTADGRLVRRLDHGDWLNAPWGVALAPGDFGSFSHDLLIAQFAGGGTTQASGYIAAYDLASGNFQGLLQDTSGKPLAINGIWAISQGNASPGNLDSAAAPAAALYFVAGPTHGSGGLLGYLTPLLSEMTKGNDQ
jgi:uncharacterized protein (TIGR03118 family)